MKTILALMMMLLSATAYGQLVKCVSKDGKVEYARDCQPGSTEHKTGIRGSTADLCAGGGLEAAADPPLLIPVWYSVVPGWQSRAYSTLPSLLTNLTSWP